MSDLAELIKAERSAREMAGSFDNGNGTGRIYLDAQIATDAAIANLAAAQAVSLPDRETLARTLHKSHCGCNDFGDESEDSSYWRMADAVLAALSTQPAAGEAHGAAILAAKAKALREAADAAREAWVDGTWNLTVDTGQWLRDRANSIERPDRPPAADERRTPAPELAELFPGTLAALDRLSIRPEANHG